MAGLRVRKPGADHGVGQGAGIGGFGRKLAMDGLWGGGQYNTQSRVQSTKLPVGIKLKKGFLG